MPTRGPVARFLFALGIACGGLLVLAGALALRGPGLAAVGVAGGVAAALSAGVAREAPGARRGAALQTAWQAAAWTVGLLLLISGLAALAGGVVAAILAGGGALAALVVGFRRLQSRRGTTRSARPTVGGWPPPAASPAPARPAHAPGPARILPPVATLPISALSREWQRTTTALAGRLQPSARASIVRRRQETLDELERRDPVGFARWLADGPIPGSDPTQYLRPDVRGDQAAGTDVA